MAIGGINDIAASVTEAGGFGFLGTGEFRILSPTLLCPQLFRDVAFDDVKTLKNTMHSLRTRLNTPPEAPVPVGVGFIGWVLDQNEDAKERIIAVLEERPVAVWLSFGNDLEKYIRIVS